MNFVVVAKPKLLCVATKIKNGNEMFALLLNMCVVMMMVMVMVMVMIWWWWTGGGKKRKNK